MHYVCGVGNNFSSGSLALAGKRGSQMIFLICTRNSPRSSAANKQPKPQSSSPSDIKTYNLTMQDHLLIHFVMFEKATPKVE